MMLLYFRLRIVIIGLLLLKNVNLSDVTYYEVLGVSKQATTQEIKQAYKKLAIKLHPDKNPNSTDQQKFLKITEAYETLKDLEKKRNYDLYGSQKSYTRRYDYHSQAEYNNLYYNGLYHDDPYVVSLSGSSYYSYLSDGLYFINFYSPFCPPCQSLADYWKKLAEVYKGIIEVASVNCKHYNSFCYNNMRISSYPSLLFYPNGKSGNYIYYRGPHAFESLEKFVLTYIRNNAYVRHVSQVQSVDKPVAYVIDADSLDNNALTRIAYQLRGLVTIFEARGGIRETLATNPETVIVFKYKQVHQEIQSTDEASITKEIVDLLPRIEKIGLENLQKIRNQLRNGYETAWVLYFSKQGDDRLLLYQLRFALPDIHFGEVECEETRELCASLAAEATPAFGVLKPGGGYQRLWTVTRATVTAAVSAHNLHTLSASDLNNILDGDLSTWVLLVVPHRAAWDHMLEPFTQASLDLIDSGIHFGMMICTQSTDPSCREVAQQDPVILVQNRTTRNFYEGEANKHDILDFIQLLKDSADLELTEQQAIEEASKREFSWLIAYLPAHCGSFCDQLLHEWRIVAKRLRPLSDSLRCGAVRCASSAGPLCGNVRAATARLYLQDSRTHYAVNLQHLSKAPYILEWALDFAVDSVIKLNWQAFTRTVISEELNPSGTRKPWLIYFHSPRCYRCYEMYPEFAITALLLKDSMQFGKVNCVSEHSLCQHEHISSYPSIRLYLSRNRPGAVSRVVAVPVRDYSALVQDIRPHIARYDGHLLENLDLGLKSHINFHDEL